MAAENRSDYVISLDGDDSGIRAIFSAFTKSVKDSAAELEKTTSNIVLFKGLKENLEVAKTAATDAAEGLAKLREAVKATQNAGDTVGKGTAASLRDAEKAAASANKEFTKQQKAVDSMAASLTKAGVNLKALGTEEIRLATATKQAAAAEQDRQAAALLGIKLAKDQAAEVQRLVAAYNTLRSNGTASVADLANAQKQLTAKLKETTVGVKETGLSADSLGLSIRSALIGAAVPFIGITAAISAVTAAFTASIDASREWRNEIAKLQAITNASEADVAALGDGVRQLSRELGFDAVEGVKALREILRAGIPQDNALEVLRASADAAKAGITDIGTAAKLSTVLINGFNVQASQLGKALDVIFSAQKGGGATIAELAAALGDIAPLAKAANIPLEEVVATVQTLIKAGLDAPTAIAQTGKIITKLADPDVAKNLADIGIQVDGLVGTITQLGKAGKTLDQVLALGIGNERSAKAVSALTTEFVKLQAALDGTAKSAGAVAKANEVLDKTPQERTERFSAAVKDLGRNLGEEFDRTGALIPILTKLANSYNDTATRARALRVEFGLSNTNFPTSYAELVKILQAAGIQLGITTTAQHELNKAFDESRAAAAGSAGALRDSIGATLAAVQQQVAATKQVIAQVSAALKGLADDLVKQRDASQKAAAQAIADINTRAAAQLAAIDKSRIGEIAADAQILAIQKKQAADRLAVILQNAEDVQKSLAAEGAARLAIAGKSAAEQRKVEQDLTQARIAALAPVRAALETHYAELLGLARTHADNVTKIDQERVKVQQDIDDLIRGINRESLSAYDAYQDKVRQIDELTSKARQELAKGDGANLDTVNELANRAKGLVGDIGKQVTDGSRIVVSATEAQSNAVREYKSVGDLLLEVLARRKTAETEAGEAAKKAAAETLPALQAVRRETDDLVAALKDGINLKINVDADAVAADIAKLQEAIAKQKLLADVELNLKDAQAAIDALAANIKKGVTEGASELTARIVADVKAAADAAPQLKIKTDEIETQVADLRTNIEKLADIAPKITATVDSNVAEVQAEIDNLKKPTESTHTVHVRTVNEQGQPVRAPESPTPAPGFRRGGPVWRAPAARGFARGGPVFRTPTWFKVPGTGSGDTVPARLQTGSFVVRQAASRYYGDGVMGALARGYAGGGSVTKDQVWQWAEKVFGTRDPFGVGAGGGKPSPGGQFPGKGQFPSGTGKLQDKDFQKDVHPPISFDARPIPEELITANYVLQYAREMLNSVGPTNRLLGSLLPQILGGITAVEANPNDKTAITALLQAAETIGSNPFVFAMGGKTAAVIEKLTPTWFVDWLTKRGMLDPSGKITGHGKSVDISGFAQSFFGSTEFAQKFFGADSAAQRFFGSQGRPRTLAAGGGIDSVPAYLTPGEFVFQPRAVSHYGGPFMEAMNQMAIPRDLLAGMMAPPPPAHFAEGGPVLTAGGSPTFREGQGGGQSSGKFAGATFNFQAAAGDLFSKANVMRYLVPVLREIEQTGR